MRYFFLSLLLAFMLAANAQTPELPQDYPPGLYDESEVPDYVLPDPLELISGEKVSDTIMWKEKRRKELIDLFEKHVYGKTMVGRPDSMSWKIISENTSDSLFSRTVKISFSKDTEGAEMTLQISCPVSSDTLPVPVFLMPSKSHEPERFIKRGYGLVTFDPWDIEPDNKDSSYQHSIRKFFAPKNQEKPKPTEWGAVGAWAWGMSRAMDYLETDSRVNKHQVCLLGFSRYGKATMWAGALDERFAVVISAESGCCGASIVRRGFGETIKAVNDYAPHWFCEYFQTYSGYENDLPVDWHMLIALMVPRPVYVATAEEDYWGDPKGSFLSALYADHVYEFFGKTGLGVYEMPPVETPVGDYIGFHCRRGGHGLTNYDWEQFFNFTDKHFGIR